MATRRKGIRAPDGVLPDPIVRPSSIRRGRLLAKILTGDRDVISKELRWPDDEVDSGSNL